MEQDRIETKKSYELVMHKIRQRIHAGEWKPGARLESVVELSQRYGVGRSTVREALSALKAMGWVQIRQGGGTFVSETIPGDSIPEMALAILKTESLKEILEVRKILEVGCAALAAEKRTEANLRSLEAILDQMAEQLNDEAASEQSDVRFHLAIAEATGNAVLIEMMRSIAKNLHETMRNSRALWFYGERAAAERLLAEHTEIFHAIRGQVPDLAERKMRLHLEKVEKVLRHYSF